MKECGARLATDWLRGTVELFLGAVIGRVADRLTSAKLRRTCDISCASCTILNRTEVTSNTVVDSRYCRLPVLA